jgi:DNA-binding response OmpR family regulator
MSFDGMNVLLIEDSKTIAAALKDGLSKMGYAVDALGDGRVGLDYARHKSYDVIVLDLMLPGLDGLSLLHTLRAEGKNTPVLILSAKDQVNDRVRGLQQGADDYLVKPFAFDELCARIASLVRRKYEQRNPVLAIGPLLLNTAAREVRASDQCIHLTRSEYAILESLALNRGRVLTLEQLLDAVHDSEACPNPNVIQVMVCSLRKRLAQAGARHVIHTRRGVGYFIPVDSP